MELIPRGKRGEVEVMFYDIPQDVIDSTVHCVNGKNCLEGGSCLNCRVMEVLDGKHALVNCHNYPGCRYRVDFGYSCMCSCPVRIAIYRKYGI